MKYLKRFARGLSVFSFGAFLAGCLIGISYLAVTHPHTYGRALALICVMVIIYALGFLFEEWHD